MPTPALAYLSDPRSPVHVGLDSGKANCTKELAQEYSEKYQARCRQHCLKSGWQGTPTDQLDAQQKGFCR